MTTKIKQKLAVLEKEFRFNCEIGNIDRCINKYQFNLKIIEQEKLEINFTSILPLPLVNYRSYHHMAHKIVPGFMAHPYV